MSGWNNRRAAATAAAVNPDPGAPSVGYWAQGALSLDGDGVLWVCTTAGSPGAWERVASGEGGGGAPGAPYEAINGAGAPLVLGHVLRSSGAGRVALALADDFTTALAIGAAAAAAEDGATAQVNTYGTISVRLVAGLEPDEGQPVWLSALVAGEATTELPAEGSVLVRLGPIVDATPYAADRTVLVAWDLSGAVIR